MTKFDYDSWQAKLVALELANDIGKGILKTLITSSRTASQLSESLDIPLPTVLFHLQRLESAGLIRSKKALGKRLREVKVYSVPSTEIVIDLGGKEDDRREE
jgi:predicted ArsR family transcriptional regulator